MTDLDLSRLRLAVFPGMFEYHRRLSSTNDRAREVATNLAQDERAMIVADEQSAGRGRGENRWWTGAGSVALTVVLPARRLGIEARFSPMLALAAATAVVETVQPRLAGIEVGLHWPNDVYAGGKKLSGVLVEGLADGKSLIGVGINVNNACDQGPPDVRVRASSMLELTGSRHDRTDVIVQWQARVDQWWRVLAEQPAQLGRRADELCLQKHQTLTVQAGEQIQSGTCVGIDDDGALRLSCAGTIRSIYGGVLIGAVNSR